MITNMSAINNETAATFFYVQVVAEDESEAHSFLEVAIRNFRTEVDHSIMLAHTSPAEDDEELETFVFAVYGVKAPPPFSFTGVNAEPVDMLTDLYTIPHLVDAPCFDIDDYNDDTIIDTPAGKIIAEGY